MTNYLTINDNSLSSYFLEINRFPVLSVKEEYELVIKYYNENDLDSAHRLIVSNLRFVVKIAFEYKHYGLQLIDLIQEGNLGLMKAVKKFNPYKGIKLISYAVWWIKAYINKYIMENWSLIKIGTTQLQRKLFYKAKQIENDSFENKELEEMSQRMYKELSLDTPIEENFTLLETLSDDRKNQEELLVEYQEEQYLSDKIEQILNTLNEKEQYIIKHRILSDGSMTRKQIAEQLSVSCERIRQIEERALEKIKIKLMDIK